MYVVHPCSTGYYSFGYIDSICGRTNHHDKHGPDGVLSGKLQSVGVVT